MSALFNAPQERSDPLEGSDSVVEHVLFENDYNALASVMRLSIPACAGPARPGHLTTKRASTTASYAEACEYPAAVAAVEKMMTQESGI